MPLRRRLGLCAAAFAFLTPCRGGDLMRYTDPMQQIEVPFGARSHWAQPWRAYLETVPAETFLAGAGVNYSSQGNPDLMIRHLAQHGIARIRLEIGWGSVDYDGMRLMNAATLRPVLLACKKYGVRPLILLNAHHGAPCPLKFFSRLVIAPARRGDRTLSLDSADGLLPGYSGLNDVADYVAAHTLITTISGHTVTLSKPLATDIQPGTSVAMATLKYRPFSPPDSVDYAQTIAGWLRYVDIVGKFARTMLGTYGAADAGFDLEVWNELTFGDDFLYINDYYDPPLVKYDQNKIWGDLVRKTADYVESHRDEFPGVRIGDGFANTIPWPAASTEPAGVTAIDKHPYAGRDAFPDPKKPGQPRNALFQKDVSGWEPSYTCLFPEYFATVIQTETLIREAGPITTDVYGVKHGRYARTPPVSTWITEVNIGPVEDDPKIDAATARYIKGKTTARYFTFFLNKGVTLMTLFNDVGGDRDLGLVSDDFVALAKQPDAPYPADDSALTSPALRVTGNIANQMRPGLDPTLTLAATRKITLDRITDTHDHAQFAGDGTAAHPALYDRDVFAFLPYEVNAKTFVIPYYVMTRDIRHVYDSGKTEGHQYDMPAEDFTLTIGGLSGKAAEVIGYDPLNDRPVSVHKNGGDARTLTVRVRAVDYPYLLIVRER